MISLRIAVLLFATASACAARADCSCHCVEGVARTLCTALDDAAARVDACGETTPVCPPPAIAADVVRFEPPPGATDCRSARILDAATGAYSLAARVCDVPADRDDQAPAR